MHFVFIPYGPRGEVETLLRQMEAKYFELPVYKIEEGNKILCDKKGLPKQLAQGVIRELPFGVKEYIFPRAEIDLVLTTLLPEMRKEWKHPIGERYVIGWFRKLMLKKIFKTISLPVKWNSERKLPWQKDNVNIIPVGIREDGEATEKLGPYAGWTHEAL